jgi:Mrp family chromosome partitioning ATPase
LIVKANSSRREIARKALQELQAANLPVLGAILNQRTFPIPEKIYKLL